MLGSRRADAHRASADRLEGSSRVRIAALAARTTILATGLALLLAAPSAQAKFDFVAEWGSERSGSAIGVATDAGGVYVADGHHRIQKFTSSGRFLTMWGGRGSGDGRFEGAGSVATDAAGNVYATDFGNDRIQKFTSDGAFLTKWGSEGSGNGQFRGPSGVATDAAGNVYVVDNINHRIQKFTSDGAFLTKWGSPDVGDGTGDGQFRWPEDVAADPAGNIYVADGGENQRIQKFTSSGAFLTKWGRFGSRNGQFKGLRGVATDSAGNAYVADAHNHRIQKFTSSGAFLAKWGTFGSGDGQFMQPNGVATDASGNVYVADGGNDRIQKFGRIPVTRITRGPRGRTKKRRAVVRFRADEPGSSFRCKLDRRKWRPCTSPQRYRKLKPGRHVLRIRATALGNRGKATTRNWRVVRRGKS